MAGNAERLARQPVIERLIAGEDRILQHITVIALINVLLFLKMFKRLTILLAIHVIYFTRQLFTGQR